MKNLQRALLAMIVALLAGICLAQDADSSKTFDDASQQIGAIRTSLASATHDDGTLDNTKLDAYRDAALALGDEANALIANRTPNLAALDARAKELGPAPAKGSSEAPDIAAQRNDIEKQRAVIGAELTRAKLLMIDSQQLVVQIADTRRLLFQAGLAQRTNSPLTAAFWTGIATNAGRDQSRLGGLRDGVAAALKDAFEPDNRTFAIGGLALGLLMFFGGRIGSERGLMRLTSNRVPQGRLRRSAFAFAIVAVATLFPGFGTLIMVNGLDWNGAFSETESRLAHALVNAVFFGSFVAGLGRALLAARRSSWRLPPIKDDVARRLRMFPLLFGATATISIMLTRINSAANASLSATITARFIISATYAALTAALLWRSRSSGDGTGEASAPHTATVGILRVGLWTTVVAIWLCALLGFVALAHMIARQLVWLGIVAAALYLVVNLIEDLCAAALSSRAGWAKRTLGLPARVLDQLAVLCSGIFRLLAILFGLVIAIAPFGTGPGDLFARGTRASAQIQIGQITITPSDVLGATLIFVLGLVAVRALQRWLNDRYLPTTKLDPGMRSSVTTLLGYLGGIVVFAFALAELGFSLERIAWVASALSVGIGFGLQAVVQNFVSGLILLIERPVKVGDWVVVGDAEGDIRRINVRATEIRMADRSTMIVPNSELITKTVRNITLADAEGRIRIRLPLPLDCDAARVREILTDALTANANVLTDPHPTVLLDSIEANAIIFVALAYTASPRQTASTRSDLLLDVLARLRADGVALIAPQQIKVHPASAGISDTLGATTAQAAGKTPPLHDH